MNFYSQKRFDSLNRGFYIDFQSGLNLFWVGSCNLVILFHNQKMSLSILYSKFCSKILNFFFTIITYYKLISSGRIKLYINYFKRFISYSLYLSLILIQHVSKFFFLKKKSKFVLLWNFFEKNFFWKSLMCWTLVISNKNIIFDELSIP